MTSRRSPQGWWVSRSERFNPQAQPVRYNFDLYGPQPLRVLPPAKSTPEPKANTPRMAKLTAIERAYLADVKRELEIGKAHPHFGYCMKLVARGWWSVTWHATRRIAYFRPTAEGIRQQNATSIRSEAGAVLKKAEERKLRALTSYNSMRTATA